MMDVYTDWHYLTEIPVGGIRSSKRNCREGRHHTYGCEIIRNGNCICLLDADLILSESTFWAPNHFEFISKYVFLTFNRSFLLRLIEEIELQRASALYRYQELLLANPVAYNGQVGDSMDEELKHCYLRLRNLRNDAIFGQMFELDKDYRTALLNAVEKRYVLDW